MGESEKLREGNRGGGIFQDIQGGKRESNSSEKRGGKARRKSRMRKS